MYKQNYKKDVIKISVVLLLVGAFMYWANKPVTIIINSNNTTNTTVTALVTPQALSTPIPDDFIGYVRYKFGSDADKAFLLLQGSEKCQGENPRLNPKAVCNNELWGGKGQDRGYWQISNYYHPSVSDWCASDVHCSTDYIYRMYKNDGNTFKRWTAGRCLGI